MPKENILSRLIRHDNDSSILRNILSYDSFITDHIDAMYSTYRETPINLTERRKITQDLSPAHYASFKISEQTKCVLISLTLSFFWMSYMILISKHCRPSHSTELNDSFNCYKHRFKVTIPFYLILALTYAWVFYIKINRQNLSEVQRFNIRWNRFFDDGALDNIVTLVTPEEDQDLHDMDSSTLSENLIKKEDAVIIQIIITLYVMSKKVQANNKEDILVIYQQLFTMVKHSVSFISLKMLRQDAEFFSHSGYQLAPNFSKKLSNKISRVLLSLNYQSYRTFLTITEKENREINTSLPTVYSQLLLSFLIRAFSARILIQEFPDFIDMHKKVFRSMRGIHSLRLVNRETSSKINSTMEFETFFEHDNRFTPIHSIPTVPVLQNIKKKF